MSQPATQFESRLWREDVVCKEDDPNTLYIVTRCWHDSEEDDQQQAQPAYAGEPEADYKPLERGQVALLKFPKLDRSIESEPGLIVLDRSFQIGDFAKRSHLHTEGGVIVGSSREIRLKHVITDREVEAWVPADEVELGITLAQGDHVIAGDWVGVVEECFEEALVEQGAGDLFRVADVGSKLTVGEKGEDVFPASSFLAQVFPAIASRVNRSETIVDVKQTLVCVNWLGINQKLRPDIQADKPRPPRYWGYAAPGSTREESVGNISDLTVVRMLGGRESVSVGDKVVFKTLELETKYDVQPSLHGVHAVRTLLVTQSRTKVRVLWQDGTRTEELSKDLIFMNNPDEYDLWPGDYALWKGEGEETRVAVVQKADAQQRTAEVIWYGTQDKEVVSVLELDPHGPPPDSFGVRRGDVVFIGSDPNGYELPAIPRIGESEHFPGDDELRATISSLGMAQSKAFAHLPIPKPRNGKDAPEIDWYGEVVGLRTDGLIEIELPSGTVVHERLDRLTLLNDGSDPDAMWGDEYDSAYEDEMEEDAAASDASWTTDEGIEEGDLPEEEQEPVVDEWAAMDVEEEPAAPKPKPAASLPLSEPSSTDATRVPSPSGQKLPVELPAARDADEDDEQWQRFLQLEEVPPDHAFTSKEAVTPGKPYMVRLQKEYRVLQSSLPDSILVRTYENRIDLMRVLIIGPPGTPYEDAPFLIDFYLPPDKFPFEPPVAHFHSWTNGNGRVNPNLYEEGKVCLSLLNTWQGEGWSPQKSSLLQAVVSIQGLVLVKEPWFCEPAYEKLRGTKEGIVNSRLYSEKAYVLSRGFIRRALDMRISGLADEMDYFYFRQGRLAMVLDRARKLVEASEAASPSTNGQGEAQDAGAQKDEEAIDRLSLGAVLPLKRHLVALEKQLESWKATYME